MTHAAHKGWAIGLGAGAVIAFALAFVLNFQAHRKFGADSLGGWAEKDMTLVWIAVGVGALLLVGVAAALFTMPPKAPKTAPTVKCPMCAEPIAPSAIKCKHCGSTFDEASPASTGTDL